MRRKRIFANGNDKDGEIYRKETWLASSPLWFTWKDGRLIPFGAASPNYISCPFQSETNSTDVE